MDKCNCLKENFLGGKYSNSVKVENISKGLSFIIFTWESFEVESWTRDPESQINQFGPAFPKVAPWIKVTKIISWHLGSVFTTDVSRKSSLRLRDFL